MKFSLGLRIDVNGVLLETLVEGDDVVEWNRALEGAARLFAEARSALEDAAVSRAIFADGERRGYNRGQRAGRRGEIGERVPDQEPDGELVSTSDVGLLVAGDTDGSGGLDGPSPQGPAPESRVFHRVKCRTGHSHANMAEAVHCDEEQMTASDKPPTRPEPAKDFVFKDPARVEFRSGQQAPVEDRTCPFCGDVKETVHGKKVHVGRNHKGETPPAKPPKLAKGSPKQAEPDNVGPCGPCRRGRCQFCAGAGCKCHQPDHFARAPRSA